MNDLTHRSLLMDGIWESWNKNKNYSVFLLLLYWLWVSLSFLGCHRARETKAVPVWTWVIPVWILPPSHFFPVCRKGECDWLKAQAHLGKVWDGIPYGWSCTEFLSTVAFAQFLDKEKTKTVRKPCWRQIILFLDDFTFSPVVGLHYKAAISAVTDLGSASHLLGFALGSLELNGSCSLVANFCKAK